MNFNLIVMVIEDRAGGDNGSVYFEEGQINDRVYIRILNEMFVISLIQENSKIYVYL